MKATPAPFERHASKQPEGLFVCVSDIYEGDVLLTYGAGTLSALIAFFSRGRFSHASIFIHPRIILEALNAIVDFEYLETGHATIKGRGRTRVVRIPHDPIRAEIWRHPQLPRSWQNFNEISYSVTKELYGKNYSRWVRVVRRMDRFVLARPIVEQVARIKDWIERKQSPVPGPFCSELVALFFEHLRLDLYGYPRSAETVSPEDLATSSNLKRVDRVILPASALNDYVVEPLGADEEAQRQLRAEQMNCFRQIADRERRRARS